ncbi:MAG: SRPBCC domain-containing protein [Balneolaceae bacterium]
MKSIHKTDFDIDRKNNTIQVKRMFQAPAKHVWAAWTNPELLDQWWAPKPYRTETKSMEFRKGGTWLYAMVGPNDETHWCKATYTAIDPETRFSHSDAFCDEFGKANNEKPISHWTTRFSERDGVTTVEVTLKHDRLEDLETLIEMGFREGFLAALGNLDEVLA